MKQTLNIVGVPPGKLDVNIKLEAEFEQQGPAMECLARELDGEQVTLAASYSQGAVSITFSAETDLHKEVVAASAAAADAHAEAREPHDNPELVHRAGQYDGPEPDHTAAVKQQAAAVESQMAEGAVVDALKEANDKAEADLAALHKLPSAEDLDATADEQKAADATGEPTIQ